MTHKTSFNYDIDNEIKITINTSIPGFQKLEFKPSMIDTSLSERDNKVFFNPLAKINQNSVNSVPENMRKKSFFNRGLFESLLNYSVNAHKKTLLNAKYNGYIDNNIKVTIDTIFSEGTVIYINKSPYLITDVQHTRGSWKIKTNVDETGKVIKGNIFYFYGQNYNGPKTHNAEKELKGGQNVYNIHNYYDKNKNILNNEKERKQRYLNKYEPLKPFYITYTSIDLELHLGTTITLEEKQKLNCQSKWNAVKKAYSEFTGKPYVIKPIYKNIGEKNNTKIYSKKNRIYPSRYTKKYKQKSTQYTKKNK